MGSMVTVKPELRIHRTESRAGAGRRSEKREPAIAAAGPSADPMKLSSLPSRRIEIRIRGESRHSARPRSR